MCKKEEAKQIFQCGFNCCQAVLSVFCEELDFDRESALKISTGFGGGMRRGEVCGAVTGAIMVIGLGKGHCIEGDTDTKTKAHALVKEFESRFEEINGSIICKKLLGYDLSIELEMEILKEKGLFNTICPKFIGDAIDILTEMHKEITG